MKVILSQKANLSTIRRKKIKPAWIFHIYNQALPHPQLQSQVGSVPQTAPFITAATHPTPDSTAIASTGQFTAQALHSFH